MGKSVSYTINAKDKTKQALKSAEGGVKGFAKNLSSLKGAIGGAFAVAGIKMAADKIGELSDAYGVQQASEIKLAAAAKNNPLLSGEAVNRLKQTASAMQSNSIYGDESLIEMQSWLAAQGKTEEQINDIMQASLDLASSGVMPLESAMKNLSKTYSGTAGELAESVPALKELTAEQMANGEAVALVAEQYKGMAASVAASDSGIKQQIANLKGDIQENLGEIWTGIRGDANTHLLAVFNKINEWLSNNKTQIINVFRNIPEIASTAFSLVKNLARQVFSIEFLTSFGKVAFDSVLAIGKNTIEMYFAYLKAIGTTLWEPLKYGFQYVVADFKVLFARMVNFFVDKLNWILTQYNKLADTGFGDFMGMESAQLMERKDEEIPLPENNIKSNIGSAWTKVVEEFKDYGSVFSDTWGDLSEAGAELFGDEFDVFSKEMKVLLNQPVELDTEGVKTAVTEGVEDADVNVTTSDDSGNGIESALSGIMSFFGEGGGISGMFSEMFASMAGPWGALLSIVLEVVQQIESVNALLNFTDVIIAGFLDQVAAPLNEILSPMVGTLYVLGEMLGKGLLPGFTLLTPIIKVVTEAFLILYNYGIRPFMNMMTWVTIQISNAIAAMINGLIGLVNRLPFVNVSWRMNTMNYDDYKLDEISSDDLEYAGDSYLGLNGDGTSSSGAGATYSQVGDVYITMNIEYNVGISAFDDNDLAVKMHGALKRVEDLGLVS